MGPAGPPGITGDSLFFDFSAGADPGLAFHPRFAFGADPAGAAPEAPAVTHEGLRCISPSAGSFFAIRHPFREGEALEIEYFTTVENPLVTTEPMMFCAGNGVDNLTVAQLVHSAVPNLSMRIFTTATTIASALMPTGIFQQPIRGRRVRLRIERRGNRSTYFAGFDGADLTFIRTQDVAGTNLAVTPNGGAHLGFRTGFLFPSANTRVVSLKWERLWV